MAMPAVVLRVNQIAYIKVVGCLTTSELLLNTPDWINEHANNISLW